MTTEQLDQFKNNIRFLTSLEPAKLHVKLDENVRIERAIAVTTENHLCLICQFASSDGELLGTSFRVINQSEINHLTDGHDELIALKNKFVTLSEKEAELRKRVEDAISS